MAQQFYQIIGSEGKVQMISQDQLQQFCPDLYATQVENAGKTTIQYVLNQEEQEPQQYHTSHQVVIQQTDQQQQVILTSDGQHMVVEHTQPPQLTCHQHHQIPTQAKFLVQCSPTNTSPQFVTQTKTLNVHSTPDNIEYVTASQTQQVFYATPVAEETHITTASLIQSPQVSQAQLQTTVAPSEPTVDQHMQQYQRFLATQKAKTELIDAADAALARQRGLQQQGQQPQMQQEQQQPQRTIVSVSPLNRNLNQINQQKVLSQYVQQSHVVQTQQTTVQQITTQKQVIMQRPQLVQQPYMDQQIVQFSDGRQMTYGEFKLLQSQQNKSVQQESSENTVNSPAVTNALLQNRQVTQPQQTFVPKAPARKRQYPKKNNNSPRNDKIQSPNVTVNAAMSQQASVNKPMPAVNQTSNVIVNNQNQMSPMQNVHQVSPNRMIRPPIPQLQQTVRPSVPAQQQQMMNINSGVISRAATSMQQNVMATNQTQADVMVRPTQSGQPVRMATADQQSVIQQQMQQISSSVQNEFRNVTNQPSARPPNRGGRRRPARGNLNNYQGVARAKCASRGNINVSSTGEGSQSPPTPNQSSTSGTPQSEPSSPGCDEIRHTAKMLVILENGEQRLITFSLPKETCTLTELLEQVLLQVNVDFIPGVSQLRCSNHPGADIEYVVTVFHGPPSDSPPTSSTTIITTHQQVSPIKQQPEIPRQPPPLQPTTPIQSPQQPSPVNQISIPINQPNLVPINQPNLVPINQPSLVPINQPNPILANQPNPVPINQQNSFQQSFSSKIINSQVKKNSRPVVNPSTVPVQPNTFQHQLQQSINRGKSPELPRPPKEQTPPPKEVDVPKYVSGMLALCRYCGYTSADFNKCQRCKRKLPEEAKAIPISTILGNSQKSSSNADNDKSGMLDVRKSNFGKDLAGKLAGAKGKSRRRQRAPDPEPEILTLSSDDDENSKDEKTEEEQAAAIVTKESLGLIEKEPLILEGDSGKPKNVKVNEEADKAVQPQANKDEKTVKIHPTVTEENTEPKMVVKDIIKLTCRSIRIGSYKCIPTEKVTITKDSIRIVVPSRSNEDVVLEMNNSEHVVKILAHFSKSLPLIAIYNMPSYSAIVRDQLEMVSDNGDYFYDSSHPRIGAFRRIILLPTEISPEDAKKIRLIYERKIDEISHTEANSVLLRACSEISCDKDNKSANSSPEKKMDANLENKLMKNSSNSLLLSSSQERAYQNLLVYPRNAKGGITINTGDYACLAIDQFLNDVIIDFYLKYILDSTLSEEDRKKYHVFSTFFYNRLTLKAHASHRKSMLPYENDSSLTAPQRRHMRVRRWTRAVNIFEKDYVIIPINESSHWFLAIICFPGLDCARHMNDNKPVTLESKSKEKKGKSVKSPSVSVIPLVKKEGKVITVKSEELDEGCSDRDEAEGSDSDLEQDTDETEISGEENTETSSANASVNNETDAVPVSTVAVATPRPPKQPPKSVGESSTDKFRNAIKQPCILIFDSLAGGASRTRVVATLRDYLTWEHREKYKSNVTFTKHNMRGHCPKVPQQSNFTDCGLYVLQYVESFVRDPIKDYHIPIKHLKEWFDELTVTKKREDISILIKDLMTEYNLDLSILPNLTFPTLNGVLIDSSNEDHEEDEDDHHNTSSHEDEHEINADNGSLPDHEENDTDAHSGTAGEVDSEEHERMEFEAEETNFIETLIEKQKRKSECVRSRGDKSDEKKSTSGRCVGSNRRESSVESADDNNVNVLRVSEGLGMISQYHNSDSCSPTPQNNKSNRDTMSYLKAKRISRHKNCENSSDVKRQKVELS